MTFTSAFQYGQIITAAGFIVYALVTGYWRRRPFWSGRSWVAFGGALAGVAALFAGTVYLGELIPAGRFSAQPNLKGLMLVLTLGGLVTSSFTGVLLLGWFAQSRPDLPFPAGFFRRIREALTATPSRDDPPRVEAEVTRHRVSSGEGA